VARDLIPPPSPAGRPNPDPEPGVRGPVAEAPVAEEPAPDAVGPSRFRHRFGFVLGALLGAGIGAVVLFVTLLTTNSEPGSGLLANNWSAWKPSSSDPVIAAPEIAKEVARRYRQEDKSQLGAVKTRVFDADSPILLRPRGGDIQQPEGPGIIYTFNGLGDRGSVKDAKPDKTRTLVQRREALELALYSFRYVDDIRIVVVLFAADEDENAAAEEAAEGSSAATRKMEAVFYMPGDLLPQLQVPRGMTLASRAPAVDDFKGVEAERVDNLTRMNVFTANYQFSVPDQTIYLVLDRSEASE
jgi:hypothetical protein